jgi:ABC-type polysaccharide/polyol phosphate export permease
LYLWPPTPVIEFSRAVLVKGAIPSPLAHVCLAADAVLCLLAGAIIFWRSGPHAAEYL